MLEETLRALNPKAGGRYADGTVGGGGHALAILQASGPDGWLYGCDRDGAAIEAARERLSGFEGRFELRRGSFAELGEWVPAGSCDGVLLDLGVSSPQLDWPGRGFSFQKEGPLDMRMDDRQTMTAADIINNWSAVELTRIFREYGEEPRARRIASAIVEARAGRPFVTTTQLAEWVERLNPRRGARTHPATQIFQALRIVVNDELRLVREGLVTMWPIVKEGGRLAIITFHSLEDRVVKQFIRERERDYVVEGEVDVPELRRPAKPQLRRAHRKAIQPAEAEVKGNPRARSAQLRVVERVS